MAFETVEDLESKRFWYKATVTRIIDGDTIELEVDRGMHETYRDRFRVLHLDTPETRGRYAKEQRGAGLLATQRAKELLPIGSKVYIRTEKDDSFGRYLADIYVNKYYVDGEETHEFINYCNYADVMKSEGHIKKGSKWNT